jgi:tetratricopeptide (TPR) repeat protein
MGVPKEKEQGILYPDGKRRVEKPIDHEEEENKKWGGKDPAMDDWLENVDDVTADIESIINGTVTDFEAFDQKMELKQRTKEIREEEKRSKMERYLLMGRDGKGEGQNYKWWCKKCFVEYGIDLDDNKCSRCQGELMSQPDRRAELMGKVEVFREAKVKHQWRKDKWLRWKKSQSMLGKSRYINYKAWEYWEPETDTDEEGDPIVPKDDPQFIAMEVDMKQRNSKRVEKSKTAERCNQRGNDAMTEGDYVGAIDHYDEGLEFDRGKKKLWTNKALAEIKCYRYRDAVASCSKVLEYIEIFEEGFKRSPDLSFKALTRRATALRGLQKWPEALEDLKEALGIFPKNKEARELYSKTKAARDEAVRARQLKHREQQKEVDLDDLDDAEADNEEEEVPVPTGPVRVEIEESSDEEEEAEPAAVKATSSTAPSRSLYDMKNKEFKELLKKLQKSEAERVLFCTRVSDGTFAEEDAKDPQRRCLKVEDVTGPSPLDGVMEDLAKCRNLWKKHQGQGVQLREEMKEQIDLMDQEVIEQRDNMSFLQTTTSRALDILLVLATNSDLHSELSASAVKNVWPLLTNEKWRYQVTELLSEWSQRPLSAKVMVEFVWKYPDPHLRLLIDAITTETEANMLPPGAHDKIRQASERMEEMGTDAAFGEVLDILSVPSISEMALGTLGNLGLAGKDSNKFKEAVFPYSESLISVISKRLKPNDWKMAGKAAGALCNLLSLGGDFPSLASNTCVSPLISALKGERAESPGHRPRVAKMLGALTNLLIVNQEATADAVKHEVISVCVNFMMDWESLDTAAQENEDEMAISTRASMILSRVVCTIPQTLDEATSKKLLWNANKILNKEGLIDIIKAEVRKDGCNNQALQLPNIAMRILVAILTKTDTMQRLAAVEPARIQDLDDLDDMGDLDTEMPLRDLMDHVIELALRLVPKEYLPPGEASSSSSQMRGNMSLLFGHISDLQQKADTPEAIQNFNLGPTVDILIDYLKKERASVQHNAGVGLTKLAQNPMYRQRVRDLKGFETLHQIQAKNLDAKKDRRDLMKDPKRITHQKGLDGLTGLSGTFGKK